MLFEKLKLEDDEKVLAIIRKHWWIPTLEVAGVLFFALLPLLVFWIIVGATPGSAYISYEPILNTISSFGAELMYCYLLWLLGLFMALANFWTDYYLDLWAVTTRRVISVDQRGFFRRFISSFRLERLQDMNIEISGVIPTLLDFGTIEAQTAGGSNEEFISHYMPKPREIKSLIVETADALTENQAARIASLKEQGL